MMDPNSLASKYTCKGCGKLSRFPIVDQDGNFYHEACVFGDGERATLIRPKTIPSFIEKLITSEDIDYQHIVEPLEGVDQQLLVQEFPLSNEELIRETKDKAGEGSSYHMALLGRWKLLGEQDFDCNPAEGFALCKKAAEKGDCNAMAYQAICILHGIIDDTQIVEKDWSGGYELLFEAISEGSGM